MQNYPFFSCTFKSLHGKVTILLLILRGKMQTRQSAWEYSTLASFQVYLTS